MNGAAIVARQRDVIERRLQNAVGASGENPEPLIARSQAQNDIGTPPGIHGQRADIGSIPDSRSRENAYRISHRHGGEQVAGILRAQLRRSGKFAGTGKSHIRLHNDRIRLFDPEKNGIGQLPDLLLGKLDLHAPLFNHKHGNGNP